MRGDLRHEIPTKNQTFSNKVAKNHPPKKQETKDIKQLGDQGAAPRHNEIWTERLEPQSAWILLLRKFEALHARAYCWWFKNPVNSPVEFGSLSIYTLGCHTVDDRNSAPDGMYKTLRSQTNWEAVKICHDTEVLYWIHALHLQSYSLKWDMQNNSKTPNNSKHIDFSVYSNVAHL